MEDKGIITAIGQQLEQLTEHTAVVNELCKKYKLVKELARTIDEISDRVALDERMLRKRFELPPVSRSRRLLDLADQRVDDKGRPAEITRRLRSSQELTRSLEDYFRFFNLQHISISFRRLRFDLHNIERRLTDVIGTVTPPVAAREERPPATGEQDRITEALSQSPLYFILDESLCAYRDPLRIGYDVIGGGTRMMQLRFKKMPARDLLELARKMQHLCAEHNCLLIINDRLDIALLSGADGIHLGDKDLRIEDVRQLGPELLIGVTARTPKDALAAQASGANYLGSGSVFASLTKPGLPIIGTRGLKRIVATVGIPVVGIGGITPENCASILETGAKGFCSIQPFASPRSAKNLAADFRKRCQQAAQSGGSSG